MAGNEEEGSMEAGKWALRPCSAAPRSNPLPVARSAYKEGGPPPEGWVDVYALAEPPSASLDLFGSQRRAAAIDKLLQEAKLPAAPVLVKPAVDPSAAPPELKLPPTQSN